MTRAVEELLDHPGWTVVAGYLDQFAANVDEMLERAIYDQATFAAMVAERRAFRAAEQVAQAVMQAGPRAEKSLQTIFAGQAMTGET